LKKGLKLTKTNHQLSNDQPTRNILFIQMASPLIEHFIEQWRGISYELLRMKHAVMWVFMVGSIDENKVNVHYLSRKKRFFPFAFVKLMVRAKPDIVVVDSWSGPIYTCLVLLISSFFGKKLVYFMQDLMVDLMIADGLLQPGSFAERLWRAWENVVIRRSSMIIAVSSTQKEWLLAKGIKEKRICLSFYVGSLKRFYPKDSRRLRRILGIKEKYIVGWFGWMSRRTCLMQRFIPLVEILSRKRRDIRFVIAGRGPLEHQLQGSLTDYDKVSFLGYVDYKKVNDYFNLCNLTVSLEGNEYVHSRTHIITKILDSLIAGVPVVAVDRPALRDLKDVEILFTSSGDPHEIATRIEEVLPLTEKTLDERIKNAKCVRRRFGLEPNAKNVAEKIVQLLSESYA